MVIIIKMYNACKYSYVNVSIVCVILCVLMTSSIKVHHDKLVIASWNMGCAFDASVPYINELLNTANILCLSEHALYPCELHKFNSLNQSYTSLAKSSRTLIDEKFGFVRGNGGSAIMWNKKLDPYIRPLPNLGSDRICVIELTHEKGQKLYIIGVYLPYVGCKIADYKEEIECLRIIFQELYGQPILMIGDWNAQFSTLYGVRGGNSTYTNAKEISKMLQQYDLEIIDIGPMGKGPTYTFQRNLSKTYIDHCAISTISSHVVKNIEVIHEHILNVSDHLPLVCELNLNHTYVRYEPDMQHVAWHRTTGEMVAELYSEPLEKSVNNVLLKYNVDPEKVLIENPEIYDEVLSLDIEHIACDLIDAMKSHGTSLPQVKYDKRLKPYWNENLSILSKSNKKAWRNWVNAGRPRDPEHVLYRAYKEAKRVFRSEQRRKVFEYEKDQMSEISLNQDIDQKFFWYLVNRKRKKVNTICPIRSENGEILTDIDTIRLEWNDYYKTLYASPKNVDSAYQAFVDRINNTVRTASVTYDSKGCHLEDGPITVDELNGELKTMKRGKAAGWDGISLEHMLHSGVLTKATITWLTNVIALKEEIPASYKKGLLVSIPKQGKDPVIKTNNRGITLLPTLYKLLERFILKREDAWFRNQNVIDMTQGAGQANCSSHHTSLLLQETIAYAKNRNATIYVAFLDIKKAFDTVWVNGLLFKLLEAGLRKKSWSLIYNSYKDYECAAYVGGKGAPWFKPERGVHQGAPLSMPLYQIFINDLLKQLRSSKFAIKMFDINIGSPSFADDISIPTLSKRGLNCQLNTAYLYSIRWQFEYSLEKSLAMIWGNDTAPDLSITFGNRDIKIVDKLKHVGITLQTLNHTADSLTADSIKKAKCTLLAARGIGSASVPVPPSTLSKLYWAVAIPRALYGIEILPFERLNVCELENAHRQNAKLIQGLPGNTPRPSPLMTLGWISIQSFIEMRKIVFLLSILSLPASNIYRRITLHILLQCSISIELPRYSPVASMFKCILKYDLQNVLIDFVMNGGGHLPQTKVKIKKIVWEYEVKRWNSMKLMYPDLENYYNCVTRPCLNVWWKYVAKFPNMNIYVRSLMAVLMGGQPLGLQCNFNSKMCKLCTYGNLENPAHVLFACSALQDTRDNTWARLLQVMPDAMSIGIENCNNDEKINQIFTCYGGSYISEWNEIYAQTAKMVYKMYHARYESYTNLNLILNLNMN